MERKYSRNGIDQDELYREWKRLVNMSRSDLELFLRRWGHVAGLSRSEAGAQGIRSGRDSAQAILRMKGKPRGEWTQGDWDWAKRQVSFNRRMAGAAGPLVRGGKLTRKYLSLLVWGHDPEDGLWKGYTEAERGAEMRANGVLRTPPRFSRSRA
jgi:hypothetical protein